MSPSRAPGPGANLQRQRWRRELIPGEPALLNLGASPLAWWPSEHPLVSDGDRLWWCHEASVDVISLPQITQLVERGPDHLQLFLDDGRMYLLSHDTLEPTRDLRPGAERIWSSEGFLYARPGETTRAIDVHRPTERWLIGPASSVLKGRDHVTHGAARLRTPRPLPCPLLWESIRFSHSGQLLRGLTPQGDHVLLDLLTYEIEPQPQGTPISADRYLDLQGNLIHLGEQTNTRWRAYSCARWGDRLAGPNGVIWCLRSGTPTSEIPSLALGLTLGTPDGFFTVDWECNQAWFVGLEDGKPSEPLELPLEPDDLILAGTWRAGTILLRSALGQILQVSDGHVTPTSGETIEDLPESTLVDTAVGALSIQGSAAVGAHQLLWNDEGWLYALPLPS